MKAQTQTTIITVNINLRFHKGVVILFTFVHMAAIIVCGEGRCGTSLAMQILKLLGVPVAAAPFIKEHKGLEEYNPKGYYELSETINGIKDDSYDGMAVKLFANGLKHTDDKYIGKVIRMKRDRVDACISYERIKDKIETTGLSAFEIYDINCSFLDNYFVNRNHLIINFEAIIENPLEEIERVVEYLDIYPSLAQIKEAYMNVNVVTKIK